MEANRKRSKVHMLPTEDEMPYNIIKYLSGKLEYLLPGEIGYIWENLNHLERKEKVSNQHLYFTTDEEIKEGDKGFIRIGKHGTVGTISRDEKNNTWDLTTDDNVHYPFSSKEYIRKIIATTDPKLIAEGIAQPSQAFIKAYCEQGGFDEVDVECKRIPHFDIETSHDGYRTEKFNGVTYENTNEIKVDPIHNTITTHRIVEKMYTREEVESLLYKIVADSNNPKYTIQKIGDMYSMGEMFPATKWIKENL